MKILFALAFLSTFALSSCKESVPKEAIQIVNKEIGFKMKLPEGFRKMDAYDTEKTLKLGEKTLEKIYESDLEIDNLQPHIFKKDDNNYFMFNVKDFDAETEGDYSELVTENNYLMYDTYRQVFPTSTIDTLSRKEKVRHIVFDTYQMTINIPPKTKMKAKVYSSLIKGKDFVLAVVYQNDKIGEEIIKEIKAAKFVK